MKNVLTLLMILALNIASYAQKKPKIKGDKNVVTTTNTISQGFNAIEIDDALEISMVQGQSNSYLLTTDQNLQDIVQFKVSDSVLKIYTTNKIISSKKLDIKLNFIHLNHITLKNDARVESEGRLESDIVYLNAYNSSRFDMDVRAEEVIITMQRNAGGKLKIHSDNTTIIMNDRTDLKANVNAKKTTVTLTKSSQLTLTGDSDSVAYNLKDSAKLNGKKMKASFADLYTSNNADVYVYAGKNLELYAQGKSNIYVYGNPNVEVKGLTDKSKIIKK